MTIHTHEFDTSSYSNLDEHTSANIFVFFETYVPVLSYVTTINFDHANNLIHALLNRAINSTEEAEIDTALAAYLSTYTPGAPIVVATPVSTHGMLDIEGYAIFSSLSGGDGLNGGITVDVNSTTDETEIYFSNSTHSLLTNVADNGGIAEISIVSPGNLNLVATETLKLEGIAVDVNGIEFSDTPQQGKFLKVKAGNNAVEYVDLSDEDLLWSDYNQEQVGGTTEVTTPADYVSFVTTPPTQGNYIIEWSYIWSGNSPSNDIEVQILLDGIEISTHVQEPKDSGGSGASLPNLSGGNDLNSGTNQRLPAMGRFIAENMTSGTHTIKITVASSSPGTVVSLYNSLITIKQLN